MSKGWLSPWAIYNPTTGLFVWENDDATPKWSFPLRNGNVILHGTTNDPYVKRCDSFTTIKAAGATAIRSAQDLSGATPITFVLDAQPDVPRTLTWVLTHTQITAFSISFSGVDARGNSIGETITQADGWSGETHNAFATITSIILTARTGTGAGNTMNVGIGSKLGLSNNIVAITDVYKCSKVVVAGAAQAADYSGAANITPEATYDTVDVSAGTAIVNNDCYTIWYKSRFYAI